MLPGPLKRRLQPPNAAFPLVKKTKRDSSESDLQTVICRVYTGWKLIHQVGMQPHFMAEVGEQDWRWYLNQAWTILKYNLSFDLILEAN